MEGRAGGGLPAFVAWRRAGAGGRGHGRLAALLLGQRDWPWWRLYPTLPRHGSGRGTTAPRSVARQSPATSAVSASGRRHVSPLPRYHAWRGTGI